MRVVFDLMGVRQGGEQLGIGGGGVWRMLLAGGRGRGSRVLWLRRVGLSLCC